MNRVQRLAPLLLIKERLLDYRAGIASFLKHGRITYWQNNGERSRPMTGHEIAALRAEAEHVSRRLRRLDKIISPEKGRRRDPLDDFGEKFPEVQSVNSYSPQIKDGYFVPAQWKKGEKKVEERVRW